MKRRSTVGTRSQSSFDFADPGELFPSSTVVNADDDSACGYPLDPQDNLPAEEVKPHARDKHTLLLKYVDICSAVRNKQEGWGGSNCYIDLYSGPGRVRFVDTGQFDDGSPLVAWEASRKVKRTRDSGFGECFIGDLDLALVDAARTRLEKRGASVHAFHGEASKTVEQVIAALPTKGFHFAFLDPYSIGALPFTVIERLSSVRSLDILLHFSVMDLRRNMARFMTGELPHLNWFAPGWRDVIDPHAAGEVNVRAVETYWTQRVQELGKPARGVELIRSSSGNHLYWLVLLSRSPLATKFFREVSAMGMQRRLFPEY